MRKILFILISAITIISASISNSPKEAFVERLYNTVLDRSADSQGLNYWLDKWNNGSVNAKSIAKSFMHSEEFLSKDLDDIDFLYVCYRAFMDREPDDDGLNYWLDRLYNGTSRDEVIDSFVDSPEFQNIIGSSDGSASNSGDATTQFVKRLYQTILDREANSSGLNNWVNQIKSGAMDYKSVAMSFMHSEEFVSKDLDNIDFVDTLYRAFMGREADSEGEYYWVDKLYNGMDRDTVIASFIDSQEFQNIINNSSASTPTPTPAPAPTPATDEQIAVDEHNKIRNELYQDAPISWDDTVAQTAQDYANYLAKTGKFEHDSSIRGEYGENIAMMYSSSNPYKDAIDMWASEKPYYHYDTNSCDSGEVCGHYTQIIWKNSTYLGCGKAKYQTGRYEGYWIVVCRYAPPGNYIGERPY